MNQIRVFLILVIGTLFLLAIGDLLGGHTGFFIGLVLAVIMNISAYGYADKALLHLYSAHELPADELTDIQSIVSILSSKAGLPEPKIFSVVSDAPNVFTTGRTPERAAIVVTTGLLSLLNQDELTAIMAQSLSHIAHYDMFIGSVSAVIAGSISGLAKTSTWTSLFSFNNEKNEEKLNSTAIAILGPIAALIVRRSISTARELDADQAGAKLCGHPAWLISALEKLDSAQSKTVLLQAQTNPASAHLFILNPLKDEKLKKMFSVHPAISERIRRLKEMVI